MVQKILERDEGGLDFFSSPFDPTSVDFLEKMNVPAYKIASYDADGVDVYWHFYLLFDKPTGKVAVVSAYDVNQDLDYVDKLLNSIRFQ